MSTSIKHPKSSGDTGSRLALVHSPFPDQDRDHTGDKATQMTTTSMQAPKPVTISPESRPMSEYPEVFAETSAVPSQKVDFFVTLAREYLKKGSLTSALDYFSRALRIQNKIAATSDQDKDRMAAILFDIAIIHLKMNDPLRALVTFDLCQSLLRWDDERNAKILRQQANIYTTVGDSESAARVLEELLGILCSSTTNPEVLRETWLELAHHQEKLSMFQEAMSSREEASQL